MGEDSELWEERADAERKGVGLYPAEVKQKDCDNGANHLVRPDSNSSQCQLCAAGNDAENEADVDVVQQEEAEAEIGDDEEQEEGRKPRVLKDPKKPKPEEVEEHMKTHLPYRSWCPHCVRARGIDSSHRASRNTEEGKAIPTVHADYMFMKGSQGDEDEEEGVAPILVMKESSTRSTRSMLIPKKGDSVQWVIDKAIKWIEDIGLKRMILKTDQEPAILA